jgi:hypothetical protein
LDFSDIDLDCTTINYFIYDSWKSSYSSLLGSYCSNAVGKVFDPTASCVGNSDSKFCFNGHRCSDPNYVYSCNFYDQPYNCSPSDLSGKYGSIEVGSDYQVSITGYDSLMIPLNLIKNTKSVALQCADTGEMIACAKFTALSTYREENDDDDEDD